MKRIGIVASVASIVAFSAVGVRAASDARISPAPGTEPVLLAQASEAMTEGEVRKVDRNAKKLTIKHGEITNLNMPAMTMVFQVQDPAMLDAVKQGDKVRFHAEQASGALTVTKIEAIK